MIECCHLVPSHQVLVSILMVSIGTTYQPANRFISFVFYTLSIMAVLILRITHRKEPRFFKVSIVDFAKQEIDKIALPALWLTRCSYDIIIFCTGVVYCSCCSLSNPFLSVPAVCSSVERSSPSTDGPHFTCAWNTCLLCPGNGDSLENTTKMHRQNMR